MQYYILTLGEKDTPVRDLFRADRNFCARSNPTGLFLTSSCFSFNFYTVIRGEIALKMNIYR